MDTVIYPENDPRIQEKRQVFYAESQSLLALRLRFGITRWIITGASLAMACSAMPE